MLDFPSLLYRGVRILMFQLSGVYCRVWAGVLDTVNPRKLEHGFRRISAGIPFTLL